MEAERGFYEYGRTEVEQLPESLVGGKEDILVFERLKGGAGCFELLITLGIEEDTLIGGGKVFDPSGTKDQVDGKKE